MPQFYYTISGFVRSSKPTVQKLQDYCNLIFGHYVHLFDSISSKNYPQTLYNKPLFSSENGFLQVSLKNSNAFTLLSIRSLGYSSIDIPSVYNPVEYPDFNASIAETMAHELWHVFQHANFRNGALLWSINAVYGGAKQWVYEGPAEYMGAKNMKMFPYASGSKYFAHHYIKYFQTGISALGVIPLYEFKSSTDDAYDYRSATFFTYLSHPLTYSKGDELIAHIASDFSNKQIKGERGDIDGLQFTLNEIFDDNSENKFLSNHFFKFSRFILSKERLDLFSKEKVIIETIPRSLTYLNLLPLSDSQNQASWVVGGKRFNAFYKQESIQGLAAKYYALQIDPRKLSDKRFAIKMKVNSDNPNKFRMSALFYAKQQEAPGGYDFNKKYALPPDASLGSDVKGIRGINSSQGIVLTKDFNDKYEKIFIVISNVDPDDREPRSFDIQLSLQALGSSSTRHARVIEPDGPPQVAGGEIPDIYEVDQRAKMVIQVPGCDPNNCVMLFEHRQASSPISVRVASEYIKNLYEDEFGVPIQEVAAIIPNDAKPGGRVTVMSDGVVVDVIQNSPQACSMLGANADYRIAAQKPCVTKGE